MIDAQWLFENHLNHLALEKYLLSRMEHITHPDRIENAAEILGQTLKRPSLGMPPQNSFQGSSTERIALALQGGSADQPKETIAEYEQLLSFCRFLIELYDAVFISLTSNEAWLIDAVYRQGLTMEMIQHVPDTPYGSCDRSTVYRTKNRIIKKANHFIQTYIPKEVSQCRMEIFVNVLKRFQDGSIMS